ncbi:hypothetical protein [Streptomyces sp. NPDC049040]|uniref:hypothetical protein n=1 Tax=Streptomyces sp. NPDC049040 TaxID=3365593 RepID=UPI00371171F2
MKNLRNAASLTVAAASVLGLGLGFVGQASAETPASGSAVISESNTFLVNAASQGIIAVPLPSATASYSGTTGVSATFPVTGGDANLTGFYGTARLGGALLVVDAKTLRSVTFSQLTYDLYSDQISGVPTNGTTAVPLFVPTGDIRVDKAGAGAVFSASEVDLDPTGADYLNTKLKTAFFTAGDSVGSLVLNFTPAS